MMELDQDYEPGLPLSPGSFDTGEQQQLVWGYPDIAWADLLFAEADQLSGFFIPADIVPPPVYDIVLRSPFGDYIMSLNNYVSVSLARRVSSTGTLELEVALVNDITRRLSSDCIIEVWRIPLGGGGVLEGNTSWLVRGYQNTSTTNGRKLTIAARDYISILDRRRVMYPAGSPQASKTGYADDLLKEIVYENLGQGAFGQYRDASNYLGIDDSLSLAPSVQKSFAYQGVMSVLQALCELSRQNGTYLAFDMEYDSTNVARFKTFINQRGKDKRWSVNNPDSVILSEAQGNLTAVTNEIDWEEEATAVYAGGQGIEEDREIQVAYNTGRIGYSPWGLIEKFVNATHLSNPASIAYEAQSEIGASVARRRFRARAVQTPSAIFGTHYNFGDYISAYHDGQVFDVRVEAYARKLENGRDEVTVDLEDDNE